MLTINIIHKPHLPIYQQIFDQIRQQVVNYQLKPQEKLPTVRELARTLQCNPATVKRAYQKLGQVGIIVASRRNGTIVIDQRSNSPESPFRKSRLAGIVDSFLLDNLSRGYTPEELADTFSLQLARWHFQQETDVAHIEKPPEIDKKVFHFVGSNDIAFDRLINRIKHQLPEIILKITPAGSLGGLMAIREASADMAGVHLFEEEVEIYNYSYIKHVLQGIEVTAVHLAERNLGLMVAKGNSKHIFSLEDLKRSDITFVNRQKGSGTRVWLDHKLRELEIEPRCIKGYDIEMDTHLAEVISILHGKADVGLGIEAAAVSFNLDFIPISKERFVLVFRNSKVLSQLFTSFLGIIRSDEFKRAISRLAGYDSRLTGETLLIK
jgi:molybdate-binding protein/DNA-binding transcriptional regulator YhcF (GntR family)